MDESIRPYQANPRYWQYRGEPVLLVGGSREDNLFQIAGLEAHLDRLASVGGNYIRNTMSDRDPGDRRAFARIEAGDNAGRYDLDRFSDEYWHRLERLLRLCREREIIVQIEVWDRFDHSREPWRSDPFNPANNVNYTFGASGFAAAYPDHPGCNAQPFFHTPPGMNNNPVVLRYQQRFVDQLLSIALGYPNVLYCMNNETQEEPAWGQYWLGYIRRRAAERGRIVWATDMFDGPWGAGLPDAVRRQFDDAHMYPFIDVSQINAWRCSHEQHRANLAELRRLNGACPRPLNNTKVYAADTLPASDAVRSTDLDGVTSFWTNILGGCASARFHRPPHGLALGATAQASIRSVRLVEKYVRMWDLQPGDGVIGGRSGTGAWVVFLPRGGGVGLPLEPGGYDVRWIDVMRGCAAAQVKVEGEKLSAPTRDPHVAVLVPR